MGGGLGRYGRTGPLAVDAEASGPAHSRGAVGVDAPSAPITPLDRAIAVAREESVPNDWMKTYATSVLFPYFVLRVPNVDRGDV